MIAFPNAKINLGLKVLNRRSDGYHNLETIFYPVPFCDILEIIELDDNGVQLWNFEHVSKIVLNSDLEIYLVISGISVEGLPEKNLCVEAFRLFNDAVPLQGIYLIHLHKKIPSGAGLGGGSSDGVFALKMINEIKGYPLNDQELFRLSEVMGSDCAALLLNKPSIGKGRGELLQPVSLSLAGYFLVIIKPPVHVNTAKAFSQLKRDSGSGNLSADKLISLPVDQWKYNMVNDFEEYAFEAHPEIKSLKQLMYDSGAIYSSMTGSGSAVYGLFRSNPIKLNVPVNYISFRTEL